MSGTLAINADNSLSDPKGVAFTDGLGDGLVGFFYLVGTNVLAVTRNLALPTARPPVRAGVSETAPTFTATHAIFPATGAGRLLTSIVPAEGWTIAGVARTAETRTGSARIASNRNTSLGSGAAGGGDGLFIESGGQLTASAVYSDGLDTQGSASGFVTPGKWRTVAGVVRPGVGRKVFNFQSGNTFTRTKTTARAVTGAPAFAIGSTPVNASAADEIGLKMVAIFNAAKTDEQIVAIMAALTGFATEHLATDFS